MSAPTATGPVVIDASATQPAFPPQSLWVWWRGWKPRWFVLTVTGLLAPASSVASRWLQPFAVAAPAIVVAVAVLGTILSWRRAQLRRQAASTLMSQLISIRSLMEAAADSFHTTQTGCVDATAHLTNWVARQREYIELLEAAPRRVRILCEPNLSLVRNTLVVNHTVLADYLVRCILYYAPEVTAPYVPPVVQDYVARLLALQHVRPDLRGDMPPDWTAMLTRYAGITFVKE